VRIHEHTQVTRLRRDGDGVLLETAAHGALRARRVLLATNAYKPLVRSIGRYVVPVYDYVLVTEPLSDEQRRAVGWERGQGVADSGNRFHYYRLTPGGSILWGGYEALYHFRNGMRPELEDHAPTFELLASNFAATFPQLEGIRFTHRWAGAIDTCSRFCVTFGSALGGRVAYAVGYTGLGVVASRFGARVALDLVHGRDTELTRLQLVRSRPIPFPPEPLRYAAIQATRRALARVDERGGRRGPWLRALDRIGAGFDS
jgi:glycine/D-amino acid oxidase-like deaminating enzyme